MIYAADYSTPCVPSSGISSLANPNRDSTPNYLAAAVANAETACTSLAPYSLPKLTLLFSADNQAAGFVDPDFLELGAGELRDQTLVPGTSHALEFEFWFGAAANSEITK